MGGFWSILTKNDYARKILAGDEIMKRIASATLALFAAVSVAAFAADSSKLNGWISDSGCGAKHAGSGAGCVKSCIKGGGKPVFVDEAKKEVWSIDNPDAVKEDSYGKHVAITATADAGSKSVHITAVSVLAD
jgi:hypothetical protein